MADVFDWKLHQPPDCNVALRLPRTRCGLDVDQYGNKRGWDNLEAARIEHGLSELPRTCRSSARPDRSGIYFYAIPEGAQLFRGQAVPDVETVQHHHRYALVWPSVHPSCAPYRWWDGGSPLAMPHELPRLDAVPDLPADWLDFLSRGRASTTPADLPAPVEHREAVWSSSVLDAYNDARQQLITCAPGSRHELARDRCMALCRMEQNGLAGATAALDALGDVFVDAVRLDRSSPVEAAAEWSRMLTGGRLLARSTLTVAQSAPEGPVAPSGDPCASALIDWPTMWASEGPQLDFLCEPFLARGRGHALYATAKLGKSLVMLEGAAALATGQSCWLHEPVEPVDVVYLDMEMTTEDIKERLSDMGYGPSDDLSRLHYYLLPQLPALDTEQGGQTLETIVELHSAKLVVIDTMSRVVNGDENDAATYQDFYRHSGIRLKRLGITYIRLDHAGKDITKGQRGSSAKADDVDVVWQATMSGAGFRFRATHRRMGWVPETVDVERQGEPLRHVPYVTAAAEKVTLVAARLDQLGLALNITKNDALDALRSTPSGGVRAADVVGAIRHRQEKAERERHNPYI